MTRTELKTYRRRLLDMAGRLNNGLSELREEALHPTGGELAASSADATESHREGEEEVAIAMLGIEREALGDVYSALARIDAGTFGRCAGCGRPISKARLDVLPHARQCIRCARASEAGRPQSHPE